MVFILVIYTIPGAVVVQIPWAIIVFEETGLAGIVEDAIREVSYQIVKRGRRCRKVVTYYLFRAEAGMIRPDKREGSVRMRWFPIPYALDRIHRDRVREVVLHASRLLQHAVVEY